MELVKSHTSDFSLFKQRINLLFPLLSTAFSMFSLLLQCLSHFLHLSFPCTHKFCSVISRLIISRHIGPSHLPSLRLLQISEVVFLFFFYLSSDLVNENSHSYPEQNMNQNMSQLNAFQWQLTNNTNNKILHTLKIKH